MPTKKHPFFRDNSCILAEKVTKKLSKRQGLNGYALTLDQG